MPRRSLRILVIEVHAKAALPVIQSLSKVGFHVVAGSPKRLNSGFFSRYVHERVLHPSPRRSKRDFQGWLLDYLKQSDIDMVFPVGGYGTLAVSEIQDEVRRWSCYLGPGHDVFLRGYSKTSTIKAAMRAAVAVPNTWFPNDSVGGVAVVAQTIQRWPVLVKPSVSSGARGIVWCYSADQLIEAYERVVAEYGEVFVQDFVPPGRHQYKVDMLVGEKQELLAGIAYGKTRMYPPNGGSSVLNYSANRPDIIKMAYMVLQELGWIGFCDFDFVDDPRDEAPKLIEINPRFPESFKIGPAVGIDFPTLMYDLAHGLEVRPVLEYPENLFLRFLPGDLLWFLRVDKEARRSTWPSWFKFTGQDLTYQLMSCDDPLPIVGYLLENAVMVADRSFWTERFRPAGGPEIRV